MIARKQRASPECFMAEGTSAFFRSALAPGLGPVDIALSGNTLKNCAAVLESNIPSACVCHQ
jgi:hypothetical protein